MLHLDPGHLLKQLAGQMRLLPVPGDASVSLPGCAFARRHDRLAGGLAVVQDAMTMLEIPSDESGGAPGRLLHARERDGGNTETLK